MSLDKDQIQLKECLSQIEEKLGWGDPEDWHNEVFDELSQTIEKQTGVLLSPTTLKRVWGRVTYKNAPSISTLNALTQFLGYKNWRAFKDENESIKIESLPNTSTRWNKNHLIIISSAALLTVVFVSFFSLIGTQQAGPSIEDLSKVEFSSRPVTSGMPNSVVFEFDLGDIRSKDIKIQQYWDKTKTIDISVDQSQATGIYYRPGYFRSKLVVDGQIIREHDLYIKSNGWLGTIDYEPVPKYFAESEILDNGLQLGNSAIDELKTLDDHTVTSFHYVEEFDGLSGDNFHLSTVVENTYRDKWAVCQWFNIYVLGSKSALIIPFSIPGCVSELGFMLSDIGIDGKTTDLSNMGTDFTEPRKIDLDVKDKLVTVSIDGQQVFQQAYNSSIGDFAGMRFRFMGAGKLHEVKISDQSGKSYMKEVFRDDPI